MFGPAAEDTEFSLVTAVGFLIASLKSSNARYALSTLYSRVESLLLNKPFFNSSAVIGSSLILDSCERCKDLATLSML